MPKKWRRGILLTLVTLTLIASSLFYMDDLRPINISSFHIPRKQWENTRLTKEEKQHVDSILRQVFIYLGEGGQSYVFKSSDAKYVLKVFKFQRFRPSPFLAFLPDFPLFSAYREKHTEKRNNKWLTTFNGHQLAYNKHRPESGLVYIQLNKELDQTIEVVDKWGIKREINLENTPFVIQVKGETLGATLTSLLDSDDVAKAKYKIDQLFELYLSEYQKGIYDLDYGIMHNIGVIDDKLIHLDVGKMVMDDEIKNPIHYQTDLMKVAAKVQTWIQRHYPLHSFEINHHIENQLSKILEKQVYLTAPCHGIECENVFYSSVYTEYDRQRKIFFYQHPAFTSAPSMKNLIEILAKPLNTPDDQKNQHIAFVQEIRQLTKAPIENPLSQKLFDDLIRWTFLQPNLQPAMESFLYEDNGEPIERLDSFILNSFEAFQNNPHFNGVKHSNHYEDHFLEGNLPAKLGVIKQTTLIRLGNPTGFYPLLLWLYSPVIQPEFLYFLKLQPSHLYINLMKRQGKEGPICHAIESLEKSLPGLHVVTLDKDSSFYWQSHEEDPEWIGSEQFKTLFLEKMLKKDGAFYWSKHLEFSSWKKELEALINQVHDEYLAQAKELSRAQRQNFIELTYLRILDQLRDKWNPASMNISCRQCMDRGPSLSTLWLMTKGPFNHRAIATQLLAPPLIIHNRPSHSARINRFLAAVHAIKSLPLQQDPSP